MPSQHKYRNAWCSLTLHLMDLNQLTQEGIARRLGVSQSNVQSYLVGRSKPPLPELEKWADVLKLRGENRRNFIWLAYEAYTPEVVWERIQAIQEELATAKSELAELRRRVLGGPALVEKRVEGAHLVDDSPGVQSDPLQG